MKRIWSVPIVKYMPLSELTEGRDVSIVTTSPSWEVVKDKLAIRVSSLVDVKEATLDHWDRLQKNIQGEVIYAVGGGLAIDAAKFFSIREQLPLIGIPTAISVDAIVAWSSAIREDGCVRYIETKAPDELIVDLDVIAAAPASIRAAGVCDVLSIATGSWDWKFAEERGENPPEMKFTPFVAEVAKGILLGVLDCAEAAGRGDHSGLKQLLDCIALETQLLNQIGHARPEEGSEHYFAYAVENKVGAGKPHAELVCPGILLMATLQGQIIAPFKQAIKACNISLNTIPIEAIRETMRELPQYVRRHQLPYGIAHAINESLIAQMDIKTILR